MEKRREVGQHPVPCWWQQKSGIRDFSGSQHQSHSNKYPGKTSLKAWEPTGGGLRFSALLPPSGASWSWMIGFVLYFQLTGGSELRVWQETLPVGVRTPLPDDVICGYWWFWWPHIFCIEMLSLYIQWKVSHSCLCLEIEDTLHLHCWTWESRKEADAPEWKEPATGNILLFSRSIAPGQEIYHTIMEQVFYSGKEMCQ